MKMWNSENISKNSSPGRNSPRNQSPSRSPTGSSINNDDLRWRLNPPFTAFKPVNHKRIDSNLNLYVRRTQSIFQAYNPYHIINVLPYIALTKLA